MKDFLDDVQAKQGLIGILFERGTDIDQIFGDVADSLKVSGLNVSGLVQTHQSGASDCDCRSTYLKDLSTGELNTITEDRGPEAEGCHLDRQALMMLAQGLEQKLSEDTDVLIINRFGQAESEGRGFRGSIEKALSLGVQVVTAYREEHLKEWQEFEGGLASTANPDVGEIVSMISSRKSG